MFRFVFLLLCFLLGACNERIKPQPVTSKGELAFLLQYNNRLPSEVGFLTNHIMERRMANLMKENFQPFMQSLAKEYPLVVDSVHQTVVAHFERNQQIIVDIANDALWIDYSRGDTMLRYADRISLERPKTQ